MTTSMNSRWLLLGLVLLAACRRESAAPATGPGVPPVPRALSLAAQLGKRLFFDRALSASGEMACATCHDPDHAYGPPDGRSVQLGGARRASPGLRAVPSLRYKEYTPAWADLLDNPDGFSEPGPGGGFTWDGRADSLWEQAATPLLSPFEMANATGAEVVAKVRAADYAPLFKRAFGERAFDDDAAAFKRVGLALEAFQTEDPSFHPYNSKFDLHVYRKPGGEFSPAEQRGLEVFNDPKTGNCFGCHFSEPSMDDGSQALFTDFSFAAVGAPRNPEIPANRDRRHTDLGVCGPLRGDHLKAGAFCGMFKTPTLRNIATRKAFFHNGVFHTLEKVIRFYNTRDTAPELWYPTVGGKVQKFDDLPAAYHGNIDKQMPLDGRPAGSKPAMTDQQVQDLIAFLGTLTDG